MPSNLDKHPIFNLDAPFHDQCPCSYESRLLRRLDEDAAPVWQTVLVSVTLAVMFLFMLKDWIGPDWVMVSGLAIFMVTEIVDIKEGLQGFNNEGVLTVMALFVVAESVSRTGALDQIMAVVMGKPKTVAGAQLRLMLPIAIMSAFVNNTPIVAIMVPLVARWAKTIGVPVSQLMIPLSYATILGGTCSLVGTSTNLVISGLLVEDYPNERAGQIGLLDIAIYGVPNALIGIAYMLAFSAYLLPNGGRKTAGVLEGILLGAKVTPWSPSAGRTVKRSGLGDAGGIYLVNVRRAATGNVHHAVSSDFVISVGDELYFTGAVEEFIAFTEKHGLEIITITNQSAKKNDANQAQLAEIGVTKESTFQGDETERLRIFNRLVDQVHGQEPYEADSQAARVIVTTDGFKTSKLLLVGVDTKDRPGLLMDISEILLKHGLQLRHSEATVLGDRSLSIWRGESNGASLPEFEDLWSDLIFLARSSDQVLAIKRSGIQVVRAMVTKSSRLIGKKTVDIHFTETYKAAIIAYQKDGKNASVDAPFSAGDILVLETYEGCPLVTKPPKDFYKKLDHDSKRSLDVEAEGLNHSVWKDLKVVFEDLRASQQGSTQGEFLTAFVITPGSPLKNKSVTELGFSKLPGAVLVQIERPPNDSAFKSNSKRATAIALSVDDVLAVGDLLWISGSAQAIGDLKKVNGLVLYEEATIKKTTKCLQDRRLVQAVIARGSPLIGYTVKEARFRSVYDGAVIAVQRGSDRIHDLPSTIKLQTGDVLLVEAGPSFVKKHGHNYKTFALLSEVENSSPPRPRLFLLLVVLFVVSLTVSALEYTSLLVTATITGMIMVATGVVTQQEARDCIQWELYVVVAAAFGVGNAMKNSGVAEGLATLLVEFGKWLNIGDAGIYGAVYFAANLLSSVLTNNAAALVTYPIAMAAVDQTGADRLKMSFILMLAASDYMTSFGYQTNLMVYIPGGYSNMDYMKFGAPMQLLLWISSVALISAPNDDKWYIAWFICAAGLFVVAAVKLTNGAFMERSKRSKLLESEDASGVQDDGESAEIHS